MHNYIINLTWNNCGIAPLEVMEKSISKRLMALFFNCCYTKRNTKLRCFSMDNIIPTWLTGDSQNQPDIEWFHLHLPFQQYATGRYQFNAKYRLSIISSASDRQCMDWRCSLSCVVMSLSQQFYQPYVEQCPALESQMQNASMLMMFSVILLCFTETLLSF